MVGNGFMPFSKLLIPDHPLSNMTIYDLPNIKPIPYYDRRMTIADCFDILKGSMPLVPIREAGEILGVVTK